MPILLLLAGVVILVGVVSVAMGRGGEMAEFATDSLPPSLDDVVTAADVAMLRPPSALWGYNAAVTDEALSRIAQVITERDVEIAVLRQQLAELRAATGSHPAITATLLARSKARTETPGPGVPPLRAADARAPEPGPGEPVPVQPVPVEAVPVESGPAGTGPADTRPEDPGPEDPGPAGSGPGAAVSGDAVSGAAVSEDAAAGRDD